MTTDHKLLAEAVRSRIAADGAVTAPVLRVSVARRAAGGEAFDPPYDTLARQIGEAAYRVTDAQVAAVRAAAGSDKAAFEIVITAAVSAGLLRWDSAMRAIAEASDAAQ
jgi:hypothetical protein